MYLSTIPTDSHGPTNPIFTKIPFLWQQGNKESRLTHSPWIKTPKQVIKTTFPNKNAKKNPNSKKHWVRSHRNTVSDPEFVSLIPKTKISWLRCNLERCHSPSLPYLDFAPTGLPGEPQKTAASEEQIPCPSIMMC